jgi:hypothetical protein
MQPFAAHKQAQKISSGNKGLAPRKLQSRISVFVSSGDAGAAGCASPGNVYGYVGTEVAVNGIASSPYVTAVGGTEFDETVNGGTIPTFWNATNASNLASATGYIPEEVWNDSCPVTQWCPPPASPFPPLQRAEAVSAPCIQHPHGKPCP